ncbi:MAG: hypothetical protein CM1200mP30_05650 [Pseudomonadota bacterium]|nr:MAG: hypothetical protein CM1200mP30_05650 [Pseudomonadota bacterium]
MTQIFYAIIDLKTKKGSWNLPLTSGLKPLVGVIERGKIHFSPLLKKKNPMATEAMYLMMPVHLMSFVTVAVNGNATLLTLHQEKPHCAWDLPLREYSDRH